MAKGTEVMKTPPEMVVKETHHIKPWATEAAIPKGQTLLAAFFKKPAKVGWPTCWPSSKEAVESLYCVSCVCQRVVVAVGGGAEGGPLLSVNVGVC